MNKPVLPSIMISETYHHLRKMIALIEISYKYGEMEDVAGFIEAGAKTLEEARSFAKKLREIQDLFGNVR